jgi:hypothetical protein
MARTQEALKIGNLVIPPDERTPLVEQLVHMLMDLQRENEKLRAEIDRLRGLPQTPKRPPQPSSLNDPLGLPSRLGKKNRKGKKRRGKRPGSAKRAKTQQLEIHETIPLRLDGLPEGTRQLGFTDFYVQDLKFEAHNIRYRRARYRLPDGSFLTAPLPAHVTSHFGPTLHGYVLYQHYQNHVTEPLLLEELREVGVDISAGQISRLLTEGHEPFHQEKDGLLPAAREVSAYFHTDDTSARHQGRSGHTLHIGNELFASFFTTDSKSRVNFLSILRQPFDDYVLNGDALFYLEYYGLPQKLQRQLASLLEATANGCLVVEGQAAWHRRLSSWRIVSSQARRLVTEAALFGSLMHHDLYVDQPLISDDAAQFKVLGLMIGLCWLHAERHVARLIPLNAREQKAYDRTRDAIWKYYQRLKAYREAPTPKKKARLQRDFDRLFLRRTGYADLNDALLKIHAKRDHLLLVLERPEIPLHNNLSENDIRQYVKKRKISAGTRSNSGRRCRDTFLSLKTTCRKLGVAFWSYLQDRINGLNNIPHLGDLIREKAAAT